MIELYFDGSCQKNGDPNSKMSYGAIVLENGRTIWQDSAWVEAEVSSVNVAEYAGLIAGLKWLLENGMDGVTVFGDSKMVIYQTFKHWRIKRGAYVRHAIEAKQLVKRFNNIVGKWIPREKNYLADELSRVSDINVWSEEDFIKTNV